MSRFKSQPPEDNDVAARLRPVAGPDAAVIARGRRVLMTSLASRAQAPSHGRALRLKPAGALAGAVAFGVLAVGAAAAGIGLGPTGTLQDLFANLNVPDVVQDKTAGLPDRGGPNASANSDTSTSSEDGSLGPNTLNLDAPSNQPADAGAHGEAVSGAVQDAIEGSDAGADRGKAVSQAACEAAHDRSTLPAPAQDKGPSTLKDCSGPGGGQNTNQTNPNPGGNGASNTPPVSAPPSNPGQGNGNPVGAPPVGAPPDNPGNSGNGNPVGAPPVTPPAGGASSGVGSIPPNAGAPNPPPVPEQGNPPVTPGTPGTPPSLPPEPPGKPSNTPGGPH